MWKMWCRYKTLRGKEILLADSKDGEEFIRLIAAKLNLIVEVEAEIDQVISWTIDKSGKRRRFISLNA
jgi:hypothetical protein